MSRLLVSKKGVMPKAIVVCGVLFLALCVLFFAFGLTEPDWRDSDFDKFSKVAAPILMLFAGLLMLATGFNMSKSWISVYDDHVEGVGYNPKNAMGRQSFYFEKSRGYSIQKMKNGVTVTCGGASFGISLAPADADLVYRAMYGNNGTYRSSYEANNAAPKREPYKRAEVKSEPIKKTIPRQETVKKPPKKEDIPVAEYAAYEPEEEYTNAFCTECGTKCRVPKGKGSIRITCPSCGNKFPFNT